MADNQASVDSLQDTNPEEPEISPPYPAVLSGSNVLIWDAKALVGNLPPSNQFGSTAQGLPLALLPEEATILLEEDIIRLELEADPTPTGGVAQECHIPVWDWPRTPRDEIKLKLYRDLRAKGYFLTSGLKFGGDYLAYPGDSMRYHSHYIVTLVDWDTGIDPFTLVALGRIGTSVKKTRLLCTWNSLKGRFDYISLSWAQMG
ncbi:tRNA-splicing endonuclease subunit [Spiromyces aspiralis]|uniref:tRNA-splicing endonuclease subunit n=1 Tax=Spiromyces aspiralis TaxID=68401 RepID=A0ACC1HYN4_9FUNG|nr:tRNA-splicing endonuclease subunit [Spiromyces aspiralis]